MSGLKNCLGVIRIAIILVLLPLSTSFGQQATRGLSPNSQDFEFPIQDLDEIKGEIIWLQGGLKRGDPSPYQNPLMPLAGYEQGLLDQEGNLWTFLDNPKGRELRYNKLLRGKVLEVKGWLHDKTQIVEVYSWRDSQSHPVRLDIGYPEPIKVPFEPESAETIEPIPPVTPSVPGEDMIGEDMWKQKEGLDLLDGDGSKAVPQVETGTEGDLLKRFLKENQSEEMDPKSEVAPPAVPLDASKEEPIPMKPNQIDLRSGTTPSPPSTLAPLLSVPPRSESGSSGSNQLEEGLTDPKEMFDASRKALLEQ